MAWGLGGASVCVQDLKALLLEVAGEANLDKHRRVLNQLQGVDQGDLMICIEQ